MPARGFGNEHVELYIGKSCAGPKSQGDSPLNLVKAIAQCFELRGISRLQDFQKFFQRPQGFAGAFAGGDDHFRHAVARSLIRGFDICTDIAGGVAVKNRFGQDRLQNLRHFVAKVFKVCADPVVIQDKPRVIFEDPQGFAGAVRIGVDYT